MTDVEITSIFHIRGRGTILAGLVTRGRIAVGDTVDIVSPSTTVQAVVAGLERDKEFVTDAEAGTDIAILFRELDPARIEGGVALEETGGWRVVNLRVRGTAERPWWQFWK